MLTPPKMTDAQFIVIGTTGRLNGKHANKKVMVRNTRDARLMGNPQLPSDHRDGRSGSPLARFQAMQAIEKM